MFVTVRERPSWAKSYGGVEMRTGRLREVFGKDGKVRYKKKKKKEEEKK